MTYTQYFTDNPPKQARSKETLERLLQALDDLLIDHYFEQIKVVDICQRANVSVGNFYRRFKSKEDLLPYLHKVAQYQYHSWFQTMIDKQWKGDLNHRIEQLIQGTMWYYHHHQHIFRTTMLYARLHPELATPDTSEMELYSRLLNAWSDCTEQYDATQLLEAFNYLGYILPVLAADWILFPEVPPAVNFKMNQRQFIIQTSQMFEAYLAAKCSR